MTLDKEHVFNAKWHDTIFIYRKKSSWIKKTVLALLFPFTLGRALCRKICRKKVLPSTQYRKKEIRTTAEVFARIWSEEEENPLKTHFTTRLIRLHTPDGAALSGVHYIHKQAEEQTPTVLLFQPNGSLVKHGEYDWLLSSCQKRGTVANFISVDYRGCGESSGKPMRIFDLILDGDTLYQYVTSSLKKQPHQIFFYGHGLGGIVSAFVKNLHPQDPIKYVNERSFSSICKLVAKNHPYFGKVLAWMIRSLGWELNLSEHWGDLCGKKLVVFQKKDAIVPYSASLYYALQTKQNTSTDYLELTTDQSIKNRRFHHSLPLQNYQAKETSLCAEDHVLSFLFSDDRT
ncbi:MAG: alpha/beta hydrolase [Chlamydiota bacterium]